MPFNLSTKVMQSLGGASPRLSCDSLSSGHSLPLSESEQTEDEADVFLSEGEGDGDDGGASSPQPRFGAPAGTRPKRDGAGRRPGVARAILVSLSGGVKTGGEGQTQGDFAFAQKCAELHGFVRPLLELLNGLKRGKYDRGLSSFQQSVAMDRIQRIVGVLQNPSMGERHLHTLLQVEMMLKLWFPQVSPLAPTASTTAPVLAGNVACGAAPRWHRDQLHIPVKKRRLSWRDVDSPAEPAPACKRLQQDRPEGGASAAPPGSDPAQPGERGRGCAREEGKEASRETLSRPASRLASAPWPCDDTIGGGEGDVLLPVLIEGTPATQDTYISSTTPLTPPTLSPVPLSHRPSECHSEPVATETEGGRGWASVTSQRRSRSLPRLTDPLNTPEP